MRKKINIDYASGILEKVGCFAVHKTGTKTKSYLYFKVVTSEKHVDKVMDFLAEKYKISSSSYLIQGNQHAHHITRETSLRKLISIMKKYCFRTDYKKFKKTKRHGWIKA